MRLYDWAGMTVGQPRGHMTYGFRENIQGSPTVHLVAKRHTWADMVQTQLTKSHFWNRGALRKDSTHRACSVDTVG